MILEGAFKAKAIAPATVGKSQTKGTPCVAVQLQFTEGPNEGQQIEWVGWMTDGTRARTAESLELLGFDGEDLATVTRNEVVAVIEHEEYQKLDGSTAKRPRVKWINSPNRGGAKFETLSGTESARLMGELKGLVLASKQARGSAQPASKAPGPKF